MTELTPQKETELIRDNFSLLRKSMSVYAYLNSKIKNKAGQLQRLTFNKLQRRLDQIVNEVESQGKPLRIYLIKSRQTGSTTYWMSWLFRKVTLWKNRNALLLAQDDDAAEGLGDKMQNLLLRSHPLLTPKVRKQNRGEIYFANDLDTYEKTGDIGHDCHIDNATAGKKGLGRSYTYQYLLCTEFAFYEKNHPDIENNLGGLFQTIPDLPDTAIIIETTADGEGFAKDFWDDDKNGFIKLFISYIADDTYRRDIPFGEYFELCTSDEDRYGNEVAVKEEIKKQLIFWDDKGKLKDDIVGLNHEAYCRLKWRRETIDGKCFGKLERFRKEYPLVVEDAFLFSANAVFPLKEVERLEKVIEDNQIVSSNFNFNEDELETNPKRKFFSDKSGKLKVYETPTPNGLYVIGGDGAQGVPNGDSSSLIVLRIPEMVVVAVYEDIIRPKIYSEIAYYLSRLYNNALLGIENNDKGGYAAIELIKDNHSDCNLYYRPKNGKAPTTKDKDYTQYGWRTSEITRSIMISDLSNHLQHKAIDIYDLSILSQMRSFIRHKDGKLAAAKGKHDDLVLALMIAIQLCRTINLSQSDTIPSGRPRRGSLDWHVEQMRIRRQQSGIRSLRLG